MLFRVFVLATILAGGFRLAAQDAALLARAQGGDAVAMYDLGRAYQAGRDVERDDGAALTWYRKASEAGEPRAMAALGILLESGTGGVQDSVQALALYEKAAGAGNGTAWLKP